MTPPKKSALTVLIGMGKKPEGGSDGEEMPADEAQMPVEPSKPEGAYIKPPEGFKPPDDKQMGEIFTGTYRAHMDEDGNMCFDAINDISFDGKPMAQDSEEATEPADNPDEEVLEGPTPADDQSTARSKFKKAFHGG